MFSAKTFLKMKGVLQSPPMIFKKHQENDEENQIDPEVTLQQEEELGDAGAIAAKLKKLKDELHKCNQERVEYLDGWQRSKADAVNMRREAAAEAARARNRSRDALIEDIIPALDSFDMAMAGEAWGKIDENWRKGMENVRTQLLTALQNSGVQAYGKDGEEFDPPLHEVVHEIESDDAQHTIASVLRRGYRSDDKIIRPAQVAIFNNRAHSDK